MCSSSSRTGAVEGLISLAREVRGGGMEGGCAGETVRPGERLGEYLAQAGVAWETELRLSRKVHVGDVVHDARALASWVRSGKYDVLHAAMAHDHSLALWARARSRGQDDLRVVRAAQRSVDVEPGFLGGRLRALRNSDGVVVHAGAYLRRLVGLGLDPRRVAVVPGSVDAVAFSPGRAPELRARCGIPADAPLAGIVALMKP